MEIRIAGMVSDSIVDGPGLRLAVFTQGCDRACPGCQNPQTHDPNGGYALDTAAIGRLLAENPLLDGLTLSGGEPFLQPDACRELAAAAHRLGLNVWAYSGFTWEELLVGDAARQALLTELDVLVDGPFLSKERSLALRFRGSSNQRLLDVKKSLATGTPVLWPPDEP